MRKVLLLIISFLVAGFIQAQTAKVLADKIVGILGDKIVLKSDLLNYIDDIQRRGGEVPADAQCVLLQRMLMDKALVLQAEKDSLPVSEEEIQAELDQRIRYFIMEFGGKEAVEQVAGRTIFQMKEDFRPSVKERRLADAMRSKIVESIKITPQEVKAYFDKIPKDSLRFYETELTVGQIILFPKAGRELEKYVIDELNDYKRQIESGRSFESFARLYTEDPGSKQNGDDAVIRHILRIPEVTQVEVEAAKVKLDSIRSKLIAGTLSFGEAVDKYSEDEGSKFTAGLVSGQNGTNVTIDELDKDMVKDLDKLKVGEYSAPIAFQDQQGSKKGVRIVVIQSKSEPHRENLRDDYNKIAIRAIEEKREQAVEKWFQTRLPSYFVMVDPEFQNCESIRKTFPDIAKKAN
jgi:peptidyl-prolyl cis-trans isomerase SurA